MVHRPSFGMFALFVFAATVGVACSGSDSAGISTPTAIPAEQLVVAITPKFDSLRLGASRDYSAAVTTRAGETRSVPVTWSSLTPALVTVSGGTVTAVASGEGRIVARAGASADTATVVVTTAGLSLQLTPSAIDAFIGDTVAFEARIVGSSGASSNANDLSWSMSDSSAARFIDAGTVTTLGEGELQVYASVNGVTASASVKVSRSPIASITIVPNNLSLAAGQRSTLRAEARDDRGRLIANAPITWRAAQPAVATVNVAGEVQGVAAGGTVVTATSGFKSASASINVYSATAASVTLSLPTDSLGTGRTMQAIAIPRDGSGQPLVGRPVAWQSSNPSVATVTSAGIITALKAGQTTLSVVCDGHVASTRLSSAVPVPMSIHASPDSALLMVGTTTRFSAEVRDQFGVVLAGEGLLWSSSAAAVATVDSSGTVSARAIGSTSIRVASSVLSATVPITVQAVPVASVSIAPATVSVAQGAAATLSVTARDAAGNTLINRPVTWSSSAPSIATVATDGVVQGVGVGSAAVTAIIEGKSAQATVVVTSPPPPVAARVVVTLNSSMLSVGQGTTAIAKVYDVTGKEISTSVTFSVADPSIASVSANGHVQGLSAGTTTLEASADGKVGIASVTVAQVAPAPVATVQLSIPTSSLLVGDTAALSVVLRDSAGAVLSGRTVSFTSSNTQVVTVAATGSVRAVGVGNASITASSEGKSAHITIVGLAPSPILTQLTVTPKVVTTVAGGLLHFAVTSRWSDGSTRIPAVVWSASGGTIIADGSYVAGTTTGTFRVIATQKGTSKADTATVTVDEASLRELASARSLLVGAAVDNGAFIADANFRSVLANQFNSVTPENVLKFVTVHPKPGTYDFAAADQMVAFAESHGMKVHGHTLVWDAALPVWITSGGYTRNQLLAILKDHIQTVVGRYQNRIASWDVVNEPIGYGTDVLRATIWSNTIGADYIDSAFVWAHAADPNAKLYINEYDVEVKNRKANNLLAVASALRARGIPIHGIGFQSHFTLSAPTSDDLASNFARFDNAGFETRVSELDVRVPDTGPLSDLDLQATVYEQVLDACLRTPRCDGITTWGLSDAYSWIPWYFNGFGRALPFDDKFAPKPAVARMLERLKH